MKAKASCTHYPKKDAEPQSDKCECGETSNLRVCMDCGNVGCCESSPGQHAKKHSEKEGHKIIKSYPPDEEGAFTWCYVCNDYLES